ncbi:ATP-binding protein [Alkalicoccobacillus gibsonii]|uniref:histidine kinase n=1 Tax=Alkalicoccobacillus gibsonii TaxID=79881 RepID=A0ABU9VGG3_9BACI
MFKTLRSKLILFFSCVTFLPLLLIGTIMYQYQRDDLSSQMEDQLVRVLESRVAALEDFLTERQSNLEHLARNRVLQDPNSNTSDIRNELISYETAYPYFLDSLFINDDEFITVHNQGVTSSFTAEESAWYTQAQQNGIGMAKIEREVFEEPTFILSQAVYDENDMVLGVVASCIDFTKIKDKLNQASIQFTENTQSEYAFMFAQDGELLAHPDHNLISNQFNYFEANDFTAERFEEIVEEGKLYFNPTNEMIQTYQEITTLDGTGDTWYVAISIPQTDLYNSQNHLLLSYIGLFSCVFIITLFAVLKLANYIVRPLEQLVVATTTFTFNYKVDPITQGFYQEADTLTRAFRLMTTKLMNRERVHQKSSLILETTENGILAYRVKDQVITTFNAACEELFCIKRDQIVGLNLTEAAIINRRFKAFLQSAELDMNSAPKANRRYEFSCPFPGDHHTFSISVSKLTEDKDVCLDQDVLIVFNDVTEKRAMQQQLVRSEKSKVVGELAAGFAHEIRNPLSTIKGFLQIFQREERQESKKSQFELMVKEIDRVNNIIKDLLNMARPEPLQKVETNVLEILNQTRQMFLAEANERNITFTLTYAADLPVAWVDADKVKQVMMNLVKNAMDSMVSQGELLIHVKESESNQLLIVVKDNGIGMSEETLERIGTPFFTTKSDGTGLGLMTCFRIAEELHGSLSVESKEGEGTSFFFHLPVYQER